MFWRLPRDDRDLRDMLRVYVMDLADRVGSGRVPQALLDEAVAIARRSGLRAARAHIRQAAS